LVTLLLSYLPVKPAIHTNGIFVAEVPLSTITTVKCIINDPASSATVFAAMYTIKPVFLGSGTNPLGLGFGSVWAKAAFHNFPAVLQFLHCALPFNYESDNQVSESSF